MAESNEDEKQGVLLYYKYTPPIQDIDALYQFYHSNCSSLDLLGRVRLSPQGVNVTVGGTLSSLKRHIAAVKENPLFEGTDFKLASCIEPLNDKVARECGFTSLSIRIVKELVTLSSAPLSKSLAISNAGKHLSAAEFHSVLHNAGEPLAEESLDHNGLVLLDARNLYETRIGKFETPNVETLDPCTRQYSDLPAWIDSHIEKLQGNHVLMYCTGGIRCEMASAYIRSKGAGFENVFQLYGGIQRYLEQFPDGGFFKGKNFVYDHRISVGSSNGDVIGKCLSCGNSFDDYSPRCRCTFCRMLVLVCNNCQKENSEYICELCQNHGKGVAYIPSLTVESPENCTSDGDPVSIGSAQDSNLSSGHSELSCSPRNSALGASRKLRILCLHGFRQNASSFKGRTASLAKKIKSIAELVFINAPHELQFIYQPTKHDPPPTKTCNKKYAWLVAPGFQLSKPSEWEKTDTLFDPHQYEHQTEGFTESLQYLSDIFTQKGPFDGILGFSQGAAMSALLCAHKERLEEQGMYFRFAILCSGFAVNLAGYGKGSIQCHSLHVYGNGVGKDRQIGYECSRDLASYFEDGKRVIMEHDAGHIIPTRSPYIDQIRDFLRRFL